MFKKSIISKYISLVFLVSFIGLAVLNTGCSSIMLSIKQSQYKNDLTSKAKYDKPQKAVYQAMYETMSSNSTIARESERRGFIESEMQEYITKTSQSRTTIFMEIMGDDAPFGVLTKVEVESRNRDKNGRWSSWSKSRDGLMERKLRIQLYEKLNGPIVYPPELQG